MRAVTVSEARARFGELLSRVASGEEILITRHEKPVARLVPESHASLTRVREAIDDFHRLREEIDRRPGVRRLSRREIKHAIDEGRP